MAQSDQCVRCARYLGLGVCDAFPDGIPAEILTGRHDHTKAFDGDGGIRFQRQTDDLPLAPAFDERIRLPSAG